jgi:hypothetical protein
MDNNDIKEIKELIVARSADIIAITTIWGLTNYVDNARNEEKAICQIQIPIPIFGIIINAKITNKFIFRIAYVTSLTTILFRCYKFKI